MGRKYKDISGQKFGRLTVLYKLGWFIERALDVC